MGEIDATYLPTHSASPRLRVSPSPRPFCPLPSAFYFTCVTRQLSFRFSQKFQMVTAAIAIRFAK
jgi:hypothetical protein